MLLIRGVSENCFGKTAKGDCDAGCSLLHAICHVVDSRDCRGNGGTLLYVDEVGRELREICSI